jgi:6-phosphofructokinase 1
MKIFFSPNIKLIILNEPKIIAYLRMLCFNLHSDMKATKIKRIGVMTSGGDAPGMNACIRAVVRTATYHNIECYGILRGFQGMIDNEIIKLESSYVANIIQRGGTILKTSRCEMFMTVEGRKTAYDNLKKSGIDGLALIGGDGTFRGAKVFYEEHKIPCIGIPGTIDKDLAGTDFTIGYDTAINTVVQAIDKIRDTADSHDRMFFVEVMGRDAGFIALASGISVGAEAILIPETPTYIDQLIEKIESGYKRKKLCHIIVVAEGDVEGGALQIANKVKEKFNHIETRVSVLGHIQRGGSPSCNDRLLASRLGYAAVEALLDGKWNVMVGVINNQIAFTPLSKANKQEPNINEELLRMVEVLST